MCEWWRRKFSLRLTRCANVAEDVTMRGAYGTYDVTRRMTLRWNNVPFCQNHGILIMLLELELPARLCCYLACPMLARQIATNCTAFSGVYWILYLQKLASFK